jgi:hypothetical protein
MPRRPLTFLTITALLIGASVSLSADRVRLRSGQSVDGNFMSADVKIVRMLLPSGQIAEFPLEDITAVEFSPRRTPPQAAPDPARAPSPITVPSGTVLNVLLTQAIDVDATKAGMTFWEERSSFHAMRQSWCRWPKWNRPATSKARTRSR